MTDREETQKRVQAAEAKLADISRLEPLVEAVVILEHTPSHRRQIEAQRLYGQITEELIRHRYNEPTHDIHARFVSKLEELQARVYVLR